MFLEIVSPSELVKDVGFAHSAETKSKEPIVINGHVFIPLNDAAADERNAFVYESELLNAPKATGAAWAVGDLLYWDATAKKFTKTATSNTACGYALQPAGSADAVSPLIAFDSFTAVPA